MVGTDFRIYFIILLSECIY